MSNWTSDRIAWIRRLWTEGYSIAEIGRRMGISKNAVVGKAHRLNLTPRPSPIVTCNPGDPVKPKIKRAPKVTLVGVATPKTNRTTPVERHTAPGRARLAMPVSLVAPPIKPYAGRVAECQWPLNNGRPFRFCEDPTLPGKSYCQEHHRIAVVGTVREATPAAIANMVYRAKSTWVHVAMLEEV